MFDAPVAQTYDCSSGKWMIARRENCDVALSGLWWLCASCQRLRYTEGCSGFLLGYERKPGKLMNSQPGEPFLGSNRLSSSSYCSLSEGGESVKSMVATMVFMRSYSSPAFGEICPRVANAKPTMPVVCSPEPVALHYISMRVLRFDRRDLL